MYLLGADKQPVASHTHARWCSIQISRHTTTLPKAIILFMKYTLIIEIPISSFAASRTAGNERTQFERCVECCTILMFYGVAYATSHTRMVAYELAASANDFPTIEYGR